MTRKIKAQDVKPGMEIEWTNRGVTYRCVVSEIPDPEFNGCGVQDLNITVAAPPLDPQKLSLGCFQEVTVLKEPQPDEPTAFGACVEVAGVKYMRCDDDTLEWKGAEDFGWWGWGDLCERGRVIVVNADPFATVQTEPES